MALHVLVSIELYLLDYYLLQEPFLVFFEQVLRVFNFLKCLS